MSGILKKWLYGVLFLAIFVVLLAGFFPLLVGEFVLPPVLAKVGLSGYEFSISRLSLNGCSIHVAGRPQFSSPIVAGNIRIDWTPSGLLHRRIEKISSNGLQINLVDLPPTKPPSQMNPGHDESPGEHRSLPIIIDQLEINNGALYFPAGKSVVYLPFTFSGHRVGEYDMADPNEAVNFQIRMQVAEHIVNAFITVHPSQGKLSGKLDSNLDLASLALIIPFPISPVQELQGVGQFKIEAAVQLAPFSVESVEASLVFDNLMVTGNGFSVGTLQSQPARIAISGSGTQFQAKGRGFHIASPLRTGLDFDTQISFIENSLQWQGTLDLKPEEGPVLEDRFVLKDAGPVRISFAGSKSEEKTSVHLTTGRINDSTVGPSFSIHQDDITVAVEGFDIDARITYEQQPGVNALAGTVALNGHNVTVNAPQGFIKVPRLAVQAEGTVISGQVGPSFTARFNVDDASLEIKKQRLQLLGIQFELPVAWPFVGNTRKGILRMDTLRVDGKNLGSFTAEMVQDVKNLKVDGLLQTPLFPEEKISVSGTVRLPGQKENIAELAFSLTNGSVAVDNLVPFVPALEGVAGSGNIDVQGNLAISPCGLSGQADLAFNNGNLFLNDAETEIENISFSLRFPDFPSLNTAPMQQFSIGAIRKKKLVVNEVKVWFEIESPQSLFIEKISGRWSGGRVFTSSFRLQNDQDELDVALFFDRVELSSILSQFSLAEAGGEGRLSGRVPLTYAKGRFFVDDGFLFSSPGEKGYLKIKQSKYLETTIPAGVPQFSPLHFAGAALADFEYNWAKLQIKSEGENLLLKLQVDGKPREKLPYRFDAKNNVFVRLDDASKGGIDQPIKLDVNFNVPVNEMLQYKDNLMPFFRKFN
jgi:hypothetical protein